MLILKYLNTLGRYIMLMGRSFARPERMRLLASSNIVMLHLASSSALGYMSNWGYVFPIITAPAFAAGLFFILAGFLFASKFT